MSFRINSNIASIAAQRYLDKAQRNTENSLRKLASGSRVATPGDDAAGFAISETLRGQVAGTLQAKSNASQAMSLIQTAEGGLNEQNNILIRLRELAVYSASDTVGEEERGFLNLEYQQLVSEFDRIAKTTRYGNKQLLTGTGEKFEFFVGANKGPESIISFSLDADTTADDVGIDGSSVADQDDAEDALDQIDEGMMKLASSRASFGAVQSRFNYTIDHLASQAENLRTAQSNIADVDIAEEVTNLATNQILQDVGVSVLTQANADSTRAIRLISGV